MKNGPCGIISNLMKEVGNGSAGFRSELNLVNGVDEAGDSDDETGGDVELNAVKGGMFDISVAVVDGSEGRDEVESGSRGPNVVLPRVLTFSKFLNNSDWSNALNLTTDVESGSPGLNVGWRVVIFVGRGRFFLRMNGLFLEDVSDCSSPGLAFNIGLLDVVALSATPGLLVFIVVVTVASAFTFCNSTLLISSLSDSSAAGGLVP